MAAKFSVSQVTTFHQTFEEDVETYRQAGVEGMGIWEFKLGEGNDAELLARMRDAGIKATTCIPGVLSVYPVPFPGPDDPAERVEALCAAVHRFAPFEPEVILCLTGHPRRRSRRGRGAARHRRGPAPGGEDGRRVRADARPRAAAPQGLRNLVDDRRHPGHDLAARRDRRAEREAALRRLPPLGHGRRARADTVRHGDRIVPSVHVCDWRAETRNDFDRVLPGDGIIDLPAIFGALEAGGVAGWFDLEIFSDDGSFSDMDFEDSLWKQDPADVVRRGKEGFEKAWAAQEGARRVRLEGRVALVTGASHERGIGRGIALALAEEGADVACCDVGFEEAGEELAERIRCLRDASRPSTRPTSSDRAQVDDSDPAASSVTWARSGSRARTQASPTGRPGRRSARSRSIASSPST